jgi:D-lactate dehydrogenase
MKIAVFEAERWEREVFDELSAVHEIEFFEEPLTVANADQHRDVDAVSTFIYSKLGSEALGKMPRLKLIATRSTGFDHIDIEYCKDKGITVCNVPVYGDNTVAEHVFGLLLAISHNLVEAADRTRRGDFSLQGLRGFDLRGKTIGVIGTGNIGQYVAEIARGFRMEVLAYDVRPRDELASRLRFRYVGMDELLSKSDVITLHVPATRHTYHLLSEEQFAKMKKGAILINTSRGTVVDILALVRALAEGKVAAAGLDVLPEEPVIREEAELLRFVYREKHELQTLLADHILLRARKVIITPHSAFYTREAIERILRTTAANIASFARGEPQNVVVGD